MKTNHLFMVAFLAILLANCTPKTTTEVKKPEPAKPTTTAPTASAGDNSSTCPTFEQTSNPAMAREKHVLYRDLVKMRKYTEALPLWQEAFKMAPAADGKRRVHYTDGILIYEDMIRNEKDAAKKNEYISKIFELYDGLTKCYPKEAAYVAGRKGFDYYYYYPDKASDLDKFKLFKEAVRLDGMNVSYSVLNPMTDLLVRLFQENKVTKAEAQADAKFITDRLNKGLKECKDKECEAWAVINEYAPVRLEEFEGVKGFYDCSYFTNKYYKEFQANPNNCDKIEEVYGVLQWGGCSASDPMLSEVRKAWEAKCRPVVVDTPTGNSGNNPTPAQQSKAGEGYSLLRSGDFSAGIAKLQEAANETTDSELKAKYLYKIGSVYYGQLKNFSKARQAFLDAARAKPNWGDPYIQIGKMYASSGSLCGPGRGFDSQRVVWPAMDKWSYAKSIDPNVASEANELLNRYSGFLPDKEGAFMMGITNGQSYTVPCWIQEKTTVRLK